MLFSVQSPSVAQDKVGGASCTTPGSATIKGVGISKSALVPSVGRSISDYGRAAKAGNCLIKIVCVSNDASEQEVNMTRKRCTVVRDVLVRGGYTKSNIKVSRKKAGNTWKAGLVYISAY
jgi:hypothetical protein